MKRNFIILMALAIVLGLGAFAWRWSQKNGNGSVVYESVSFTRERMETTIDSTAVVEPRNRLEIKPPIGGRINDVLVIEGQEVTNGDIIAHMSSTERATLLDAARARGADVLEKWEDAYKATPIIAPLDGTIIARNMEPGQTVMASDTVLVLSDRLIVSARVDETDIGMVQVGQRARITLDAFLDVKVEGAVSRIAFEAITVNNVTIYEVEVEPDEIPQCMKSGMTASVKFIIAEADDALTLPTDAISSEAGKHFVLVARDTPDNAPERWRVLTGLSSGGRIEILAGLNGNELLVRKTFAIARNKNSETSSPFVSASPGRGR